ncbi:hypothetical protein PIB30_022224 [Stylosanthes scabra]|uniref:Uncharacterized protein n=1 Tax=Stylosanthes scabra TaxID=79078 RepID=A0ABU6Z9E6_9FABA|nr:hypothetical protein [Stylosanthes scabra]
MAAGGSSRHSKRSIQPCRLDVTGEIAAERKKLLITGVGRCQWWPSRRCLDFGALASTFLLRRHLRASPPLVQSVLLCELLLRHEKCDNPNNISMCVSARVFAGVFRLSGHNSLIPGDGW